MSHSQTDTPPFSGRALTNSGFARLLFDGVAPNYDTWAQVLSYGQYGRWHQALVSVLPLHADALVLDLATGTGAVGRTLRRRYGCRVVGLDMSPGMLASARHRDEAAPPEQRLDLFLGNADCVPFRDSQFDAVALTFLLRYTPDPAATLHEVARVTRPGGTAASLEFFIPPQWVWRWLWYLHTGLALPAAGLTLGKGWGRVGQFLGRSIRGFYRGHSLTDLSGMWQAAGFAGVEHRLHSLGGAVVTWGYRR